MSNDSEDILDERNAELRRFLSTFIGVSIKEIERRHDSGEIGREDIGIIRRHVPSIQYEPSSKGYQSRIEHLTCNRLKRSDIERVMSDVITNLPEYVECLEAFERHYPTTSAYLPRGLMGVLGVALATAEGSLEAATLEKRIDGLFADLEQRPCEYVVSVWIEGIFMETDRIEFADGIAIRRPIPGDLAGDESADPLMNRFSSFRSHRSVPDAIIDYASHWQATVEAQESVEFLVKLLTLFRTGTVYYMGYELEAWSDRVLFSPGKITIGSGSATSSEFKYSLRKEDGRPLDDLYRKVLALIPSDAPPKSDAERKNPVKVAFPRYRDALYRGTSYESRIASAVSCLEGLFFTDNEQMELSKRLSQRVTVVVRHFLPDQPQEIFGTLSEAYSIRSKYVHGELLKESKQKSAAAICGKVLDYARISLLVFMQLGISGKGPKESLLKDLDRAMIDPDHNVTIAANLAGVLVTN